jgi:spermidine/putrescine transport system ATP-binding protein
MTTAVDIRDVTKIYSPGSNQAVKALDNVSLTINDNEFFTLLGPLRLWKNYPVTPDCRL